ncbi:hypothetical protein ACWC2T_19040 [Streptomyces sp. NPDC001393]
MAGAIAGRPSSGAHFVPGFHTVAVGSALRYVVAAVLALRLLPGDLLPLAGHDRSVHRVRWITGVCTRPYDRACPGDSAGGVVPEGLVGVAGVGA